MTPSPGQLSKILSFLSCQITYKCPKQHTSLKLLLYPSYQNNVVLQTNLFHKLETIEPWRGEAHKRKPYLWITSIPFIPPSSYCPSKYLNLARNLILAGEKSLQKWLLISHNEEGFTKEFSGRIQSSRSLIFSESIRLCGDRIKNVLCN